MNRNNYFQDGRLDVVVLGPMDNNTDIGKSTQTIGKAIENLLQEEPAQKFLSDAGVSVSQVHTPSEWDDSEIIDSILARIDAADIIVVNITPKEGKDGAGSPNVYYELGLVHSLGLPVIMVREKGTKIPFYFRSYKIHDLTFSEGEQGVMKALRTPLHKFLDIEDETDFTNNKITQFYKGLPVVDISAAVGLATGYYYNFVGRLLKDGLFATAYPDKIKHVIIVRPNNILNTYSQDRSSMESVLTKAGFTLKTEKLDEPEQSDKKGPIWIDHVDGVVLDLPRTIYPLKISPKLLTMQDRLDKIPGGAGKAKGRILIRQHCELMLDRVEQAILFHVNHAANRESIQSTKLSFARIDQLPTLLLDLGVRPTSANE